MTGPSHKPHELDLRFRVELRIHCLDTAAGVEIPLGRNIGRKWTPLEPIEIYGPTSHEEVAAWLSGNEWISQGLARIAVTDTLARLRPSTPDLPLNSSQQVRTAPRDVSQRSNGHRKRFGKRRRRKRKTRSKRPTRR
jgi:hypothetical protein